MQWTIGHNAHGKIRIDYGKHAVAEVFLHPDCDGSANARLIAAAPDLLECLEKVMRLLPAHGPYVAYGEIQLINECFDAIAKAKGQ
jgi:hypothetical protein